MTHTATFRGHTFNICEGEIHKAYSLAIFSPGGEEHDFREQHWHPQPGQFVVDVGASYGAYALTAAACGAKVLAFEPEATVAVDLERNVALNPGFDVEVRREALGSVAGPIDMREFAPHWPQQTISGPYPARTLDSFGLERCDIAKIDVEGWEVEVLKGAMETLKRCGPEVVVEVHTFIAPALLDECRALLIECGYTRFDEFERDPCVMLVAGVPNADRVVWAGEQPLAPNMDSHPWTKESPEGSFECWCGAACDGVRRPDRADRDVILQTVCVNGRVCCDYSPDQILAALRTGVHQFSKGVMP